MAIVATLLAGVLAGVVIGIGLSLLWLVWVVTHPRHPSSPARPTPRSSATSTSTPTTGRSRGSWLIRLDGGLFFATSDALEDRVRHVILEPEDLLGVVLDCGAIDFIDSQGSAQLGDIVTLAEELGITCGWHASSPPCRSPSRGRRPRPPGHRQVHGNVHRAVQAQRGPALTDDTRDGTGTATAVATSP